MALWRAARLGTGGKTPEFRLPPEGLGELRRAGRRDYSGLMNCHSR